MSLISVAMCLTLKPCVGRNINTIQAQSNMVRKSFPRKKRSSALKQWTRAKNKEINRIKISR